MPIDEYFSSAYQQARSKFLDAAHGAKAQVSSHILFGQKGPHGSELAVDVAVISVSDRPNLVVILSGTHGVEGLLRVRLPGRISGRTCLRRAAEDCRCGLGTCPQSLWICLAAARERRQR